MRKDGGQVEDKKNINRRQFIPTCLLRLAPFLSLLGLRIYTYTFNNGVWYGWIEWCGKCVGFIPFKGNIFWMK